MAKASPSAPPVRIISEEEKVEAKRAAEQQIKKFQKAVKALDKRNPPQKILVWPDKKLKVVAEPVDFVKMKSEEIISILCKLGATLGAQTWGTKSCLAAPQIGINKRIMTVGGHVMINPTWNPCKQQKELIVEGCYCTPGRAWKLERARYGWASWFNEKGEKTEVKLNGMFAIAYQQTIDHLDGICSADNGEEMDVMTGRPLRK